MRRRGQHFSTWLFFVVISFCPFSSASSSAKFHDCTSPLAKQMKIRLVRRKTPKAIQKTVLHCRSVCCKRGGLVGRKRKSVNDYVFG